MRLDIKVKSSLLVGGQTQPSVVFDRATARDATGCPRIPGSALKGLLRHALASLLAGDGVPCCHGADCLLEEPCPVCRLFGCPGLAGKVRCSDARLAHPDQAAQFTERDGKGRRRPTGLGYQVRPGVAVSRKLGTALEDRLFFFETTGAASEDLCFTAELEELEELPAEERRWLRAAASAVAAVGAGKSRGLGRVEMSLGDGEETLPPPAVLGEARALLVLAPREPVRVTPLKSGGRFYPTHDHIPASAVRGAAAAAVARHLGPDARRQLFLERPVHFANLYPARAARQPPLPVPATARFCKAYPGFEVDVVSRPPTHGVRDVLLADLVADAVGEVYLRESCPQCSGPLRPVGGGFVHGTALMRPDRQVVTKTAVDLRLGTVKEGALYSYECLDPEPDRPEADRLKYYGVVTADTAEDLTLLARGVGQRLTVGGARSRGFGRCQVEWREAAPEDPGAALDGFNRKLAELAGRAAEVLGRASGTLSEMATRLYAAVILSSDLVLADWTDPRGSIESLLPRGARIERLYARCGRASGWNAALGLEKDLLPTVAMGSVVAFSVPGSERDRLLDWAAAGERGMGLRCAGGFGRFAFCVWLHVERALPIQGGERLAARDARQPREDQG